MDIQNLISEFYYDENTGYINSSSKLYKKLLENNINVKIQDVKYFLENQETVQVNKRVNTLKHFNSVVASKIRECYQMDIIIFDRWTIHNYKYISRTMSV